LQIEKLSIEKGICQISLNKLATFKTVLDVIDKDEYTATKKEENKSIFIKIHKIESSPITQFRLETIEKVLKKLLKFSQFSYTEDQTKATINLLLTSRSNLKASDSDKELKPIVCAVVCDDGGKKTSQLEAEKYLENRQNDMHLIAVHKFGLRVKNDKVRRF
jgi:hypothetical protein